jgi:hypothetical protein
MPELSESREEDMQRGLIDDKYFVRRRGDTAGKHDDCKFFVLDPAHDPLALKALEAYATECEELGFEQLADDLYDWLGELTGDEG